MKYVFKMICSTLLAMHFTQTFAAGVGNMFNITSSGISLPRPVSFTLCLNVSGDIPLSCQDYTANKTTLTIRTAIPRHTYQNAGIRLNTQGYIVTVQGAQYLSTENPLIASGFTRFRISNTQPVIATLSTQGQAALQTSVSDLALSVTGYTEYGVAGNPASGLARVITVTNSSTVTALNVSVSATGLPAGTNITAVQSSCAGTLVPNASCSITVTPGAVATSNCTSGSSPTAGTVSISASNAGTVSTNVTVLGYGCIYGGGYVFALDDSTPISGSVAGKVAAQTNESGFSSWGPLGINTGATSSTDGLANTDMIVNLIGSYPAAEACYNKTTGGYTDWYLPAICEMGYYDGSPPDPGCGSAGTPLLQNMQANLVDFNNLNLLSGITWSSTEFSMSNTWEQFFAAGGGAGQANITKSTSTQVRCVRGFTS